MLTTPDAPAVLIRRSPPEGSELPEDTTQSLKMPREPVERAKVKAEAEGRTITSVIRDGIILFMVGDLVPKKMPRAPYSSGGWPTPASVQLSAVQWQLFRDRAQAAKTRYGFKPSVSSIAWQYLEQYAPDGEDTAAE